MSASTNLYTPLALTELGERIEYEAWLLEAVYDIANQQLIAQEVAGHLIYPKNGGAPKSVGVSSVNGIMGDWRPGFKDAGAPLVFVTAFKLLDILIEWILITNSKLKNPSSRFYEKIKLINSPAVFFPDLIGSRSWLRERLIALYEQLEPLRGTIIHDRHFTSTNGILYVSSSKGGDEGLNVTISAEELSNIANILVSLMRYIEGGRSLDTYQEKLLRYQLDTLIQVHSLPPLGQLLPVFFKVCFYDIGVEQFEFDISKIKEDMTENCKDRDVVSFDIHIVDNTGATTHIIPWDKLQASAPRFSMIRAELAAYAGSCDWRI